MGKQTDAQISEARRLVLVNQQRELDFLRAFYEWVDFGPAHEDVLYIWLDYCRENDIKIPVEYEEGL
jgi:hypothetical protein